MRSLASQMAAAKKVAGGRRVPALPMLPHRPQPLLTVLGKSQDREKLQSRFPW